MIFDPEKLSFSFEKALLKGAIDNSLCTTGDQYEH